MKKQFSFNYEDSDSFPAPATRPGSARDDGGGVVAGLPDGGEGGDGERVLVSPGAVILVQDFRRSLRNQG